LDPEQSAKHAQHDPRFVRLLPWAQPYNEPSRRDVMQGLMLLLYSAVLIVLPLAYVSQMVARKQWNMRWMLGLPAVLALWLLFYAPRASLGTTETLGSALLWAPVVVALSALLLWLVRGRFRRFAGWVLLTLLLTVILGAISLAVQPHGLEVGERYAVRGAYLLLFPVSYLMSFLLTVWLGLAKLVRWLRSRRGSLKAGMV
jgi:hypothetical protein